MLIVFSATLFTSATLLFWVQPMFTKMVLPLLGGSPAVWNTCLVFFQGTLLVGYLYAHLTTQWLSVRRQALLHLGILTASLATLPIAAPDGWMPPVASNPTPWLILLLTVSLGVPFFILSSTAPLLQRWFAHVEHPAARNPYTLYATSNLGSLTALLAYPVLIEPNFRLAQQSWLWTGGYGVLWALSGITALLTWRSLSVGPHQELALDASDTRVAGSSSSVRAGDRLRWIALSFVPSSLLLGVTNYLTTDIAPVPMLWVIPLALYLLTFVIVFSRRRIVPHRSVVLTHAMVVPLLIIVGFWDVEGAIWWLFPLHLLVFFVTALVLHGELAGSRPPVAHLTEFYLWISVGGVLGGIFNALIAPVVFDSVIEYELMIVSACLLRPSRAGAPTGRVKWLIAGLPLLPAFLLLAGLFIEPRIVTEFPIFIPLAFSLLAGLLIYHLRHSPMRFTTSIAVIFLAAGLASDDGEETVYADRSFFGPYAVVRNPGGAYHMLYHGTTIHGAQFLDDTRRLKPLTYYHADAPVGQVFAGLGEALEGQPVGVVGLGTGSLLCHGRPNQLWTFYEIDPGIERVARDTRYFTFLSECPAQAEVVLGDARLSLAQARDRYYGLIVLDAFSSDAIPVHLLTQEALALYLEKLADGGVLMFHISNRYLALEPVLADLAWDAGLVGLIQYSDVTEEQELELAYDSDWVVMARDSSDLRDLVTDSRWSGLVRSRTGRVWTDDYSNLFSVLDWR